VIDLQGVSLRYPSGRWGVDQVSFQAANGTMTVLIGPSGSGKTSLLRLIAGLQRPTAGMIELDGRRIDLIPPAARHVAWLPQSSTLLSHLTVEQNILLPTRLRRDRKSHRPDDAGTFWMDRLGIQALRNSYPADLSAGQQQRVSLARALVAEPAILLLDEPFSHLDPPARKEFRELLKLALRSGQSDSPPPMVVWATHDPADVLELADRILVLQEGRLIQEGTPSELIDHPANDWVRAMMASSLTLRA
jgi:ABC-type Fe3+/spermidine/putrescine transport system ATPase subunit